MLLLKVLIRLMTYLLLYLHNRRKAMAVNGNPTAYSIKVPMRDKSNCDFSYAGLKNSFRMSVIKAREELGIIDYESTNAPAGQMETAPPPVVLPDTVAADLCATFQNVAFSHVEGIHSWLLIHLR